jgi:hypothetical protein
MNGPSGPLGFIRNFWNIKRTGPKWAKILTIPHQIPEAHRIFLWFQYIVLYIDATVENVKLNFHLDLYVTLVSNLDSGLHLELQVFCESSFNKAFIDTRLSWDLPAGGAYASYSLTFH